MKGQLALLDDDEAAEIEAGYVWREQVYGACRAYVRECGGYEVAAAALDRRWGGKGRPVSATLLRSALNDVERNNARIEWLDWFARRSPEVAELMARRIKPKQTPEEYAAALEAEIREELSHKTAERVLRKARTR